MYRHYYRDEDGELQSVDNEERLSHLSIECSSFCPCCGQAEPAYDRVEVLWAEIIQDEPKELRESDYYDENDYNYWDA